MVEGCPWKLSLAKPIDTRTAAIILTTSAAQRRSDQFCRSSDHSRKREKKTEILGRAQAGKK
jgi:hypothetical protein